MTWQSHGQLQPALEQYVMSESWTALLTEWALCQQSPELLLAGTIMHMMLF